MRFPFKFTLLALVAVLAAGLYLGSPVGEGSKSAYEPGTYEVVSVADGDTFTVSYNGEDRAVRLIGIDAPEMSECFGPEAAAEARRLLNGESVRLETDSTQDQVDTYGRLLAYAYLPDRTLLNEHLLLTGYAREYTHIYPYQHQSAFQSTESEAKGRQIGLWNSSACGN